MFEIPVITEEVKSIEKNDELTNLEKNNIFNVKTNKNKYITRNIIIATGTNPKKLGIPGEIEYSGKGVSYCATCDGMLYKKRDVAVIGGGNTALESITLLSEICNNVYVFLRGDKFRGEQIVVDKIMQKENVHIIYNTTLKEIKGNKDFVTSIETTNRKL
jgi:thioredoxin-disulfide reductase